MELHEIKGLHCLPHADSVQNLLPFYSTQKHSASNHYMQPVVSSIHSPSHANLAEINPDTSSLYNKFLGSSLIHTPLHILSPNTSSQYTDSTLFHEQRDPQPCISNEKKLRRMISNRESARRSRMRRKKQIDDLQYRVNQLQNINHQLSEKVIHLLESNHQILQENSQLKEKVSSFQVVLSDLLTPLRNVEEEDNCNSNRLKCETSN